MRRDFSEYNSTQIPIKEYQLGEIQMMEEVDEHVGNNYAKILDSSFVAQTVVDSLFLREEAR